MVFTTKASLRIFLLPPILGGVILLAWRIPVPSSRGMQAQADEKLVIVTPHWDGIRDEFGRGFASWYRARTGRTVALEYLDPGGTSDCVKYIKSEFKRKPHGIDVDLFFGGGTDPYLDLEREGLLAPVAIDSPVISAIPQNYSGIALYDAEGYWYGAVLSGFGIIFNKRVAQWMHFDLPREWKDLANPRYATWIGIADLRNSGTMHLMFEIILQSYGWEEGWAILTGIAANARTFAKGASDVPRMVSRGDMAFGLAIDFYGWSEVSEAGEDKVGFLLPEDLTVISADALAVVRGAPNREAARLFIQFVLSEEGQKLWFLRKGEPGGPREHELNRMSVRPDFYERFGSLSNVKQNPFTATGGMHFDHDLASRRWAILNDLAGLALIDMREGLQKAWRTAAPNGGPCTAWRSVAVDESTCVRLAETAWNDPLVKNNILVGWQRFFQSKYRKLLEEKPCTK